MWFMQNAIAKPDNAGAGATDYMHLFGLVALGYMWAQIAKAAQGIALHQLVLAEHEADILHLGVAGGEVIVPEERQLFTKRMTAVEHPVKPPSPQLLIVV